MSRREQEPLLLFYSYSPKDNKLRERLDLHLTAFKRKGLITTWSEHEVTPGGDVSQQVIDKLSMANIILLLISADFIASDFCYSIHMERILLKHKARATRVVPILLRPVHWTDAPFGQLQPLPAPNSPVSTWRDREGAFFKIAQGIEKVALELQSPEAPQPPLPSVNLRGGAQPPPSLTIGSLAAPQPSLTSGSLIEYYEKALELFENALSENPQDGYCWYYIAEMLKVLKQYPKALWAYNRAFSFGLRIMGIYAGKAKVLYGLKEYQRALDIYYELLSGPNVDDPYCLYSYSIVAYKLQRFKEAITSYKRAVFCSRSVASTYQDINSTYQDDANALDVPEGFIEMVGKS